MNVKPLLIILFILVASSEAWAADCTATGVNVPNMQWKQISLPCKPPGAKNTVASIFGDTIKSALGRDAIINTDFAMYAYTGVKYDPLKMDSELKQGVGYWIIQGAGKEIQFEMPAGSKATRTTGGLPYDTYQGISLNTAPGSSAWSMVGNPFGVAPTGFFIDFDGYKAEAACLNPGPACPLSSADKLDIVHKTIYRYNPVNNNYDKLEEGRGINPWDSFWVATMTNADAKDYVELIIGVNAKK